MEQQYRRNRDYDEAPKPRKKTKKKKRKGRGKVFKAVLTVILVCILTGAMMLCMAATYVRNVIIPDAGLELGDFAGSMNLTTTMYYRNPNGDGWVAMQTLYSRENRVWVTLDEVPKDLVNAAIAIEDRRFMKHNGVDWKRTAKGILNMFTGKDIVGGSTITQQLIKNLTEYDEVTVKRKITEIFRALEFEKNYSKEDILTWYLNYIYLGQGCRGVYTASYAYFGKNVSELSLAECASLIGITNNPSKYNPFSTLEVTDPETGEVKTAKDFNKQRQEAILYAMAEQKMITEEERDAAIAEELVFDPTTLQTQSQSYTWYEDAVIKDVIQDLQSAYNLSREAAEMRVFSGGLEIYTCMDPNVQAAVDAVYNDRANLNYTSATGQPLQSAIAIVENKTGNVVAMAGGVGEKSGSRSFNRATDSLRPPGSSIKPLAVYSPALELGIITPSSTEVDSPVKDGWPVNSTNVYQGTVTISKAVRESINTVAVKTLQKVTPEVSFEFMRDKFNIKLVESRNIGGKNYTDIGEAQLGLGGLTDGVSPLEMAAAYSTFPRQGTYIKPRTYSVVLDSKGEVVLDNTEETWQALSQKTTYYMTSMLKQVVSSGTGTRANFSGQEIAGKTGTTTSRKDLWFVGYTPYYTAAVWTGYDKQERLDSKLSNPSVLLWKQVMEAVHKGIPYSDFAKPDTGMTTMSYCVVSGKLPGPYCGGHVATGVFFEDDAPTGTCTVHRPAAPSTDPEGGGEGGEGGENPPAAEPAPEPSPEE